MLTEIKQHKNSRSLILLWKITAAVILLLAAYMLFVWMREVPEKKTTDVLVILVLLMVPGFFFTIASIIYSYFVCNAALRLSKFIFLSMHSVFITATVILALMKVMIPEYVAIVVLWMQGFPFSWITYEMYGLMMRLGFMESDSLFTLILLWALCVAAGYAQWFVIIPTLFKNKLSALQ